MRKKKGKILKRRRKGRLVKKKKKRYKMN